MMIRAADLTALVLAQPLPAPALTRTRSVLDELRRFSAPFVFFASDSALGPERCDRLERLFALDLPWIDHGGSFYEVSNCDVTERVDAGLRGQLATRVAHITGLALGERVGVTLQRMMPGQRVGVHSDRPLVGYETVRVVVQLNRGWRPEHGGVLRIHAAHGSQGVTRELPPRFDTAFGFVMRPGSHHSVTAVRRERHSVVFNFWHIGNDEQLATRVRELFQRMQFADLPAELATIAEAADRHHPEEVTHRAACVAMVLMRWGYPFDVVATGYRRALVHPMPDEAELGEATAAGLIDDALAIVLARWAARLYLSDFDLDCWQRLAAQLQPHRHAMPPRLRGFFGAAFPG